MRQVTLVTLYGEKIGALEALTTQSQQLVAMAAGAAFTPYDVRQIHATLIGLETAHAFPPKNASFAKHHRLQVDMDFDGFFAYLRQCDQIPFKVQIGGFANRPYPFTSRGQTPYERSFSVQGDRVVMMGWPLEAAPSPPPPTGAATFPQKSHSYPGPLDTIRRAAQQFGILHPYQKNTTDIDNDLFFRIGILDPISMTDAATRTLEDEVRHFLSSQPPLIIEIRVDDIYIAAYEDDRLPLASTPIWALTDPNVTGDFVTALFE